MDREAEEFQIQKEELSEVRWFDFEECVEDVKNGTIPNCIYVEELEMVGKAARMNLMFGSEFYK